MSGKRVCFHSGMAVPAAAAPCRHHRAAVRMNPSCAQGDVSGCSGGGSGQMEFCATGVRAMHILHPSIHGKVTCVLHCDGRLHSSSRVTAGHSQHPKAWQGFGAGCSRIRPSLQMQME